MTIAQKIKDRVGSFRRDIAQDAGRTWQAQRDHETNAHQSALFFLLGSLETHAARHPGQAADLLRMISSALDFAEGKKS